MSYFYFIKILLFSFLLLPAASFASSIFINEINYLAIASPAKGIELAGDAGTNLNGWKLAFYGANGIQSEVKQLSGIIPDLQNSKGAIWIEIDQNMPTGPTGGGVIIIRPDDGVEQFLSFGSAGSNLVAVDGAAVGKVPQYIGNQLEAGHTLQLTGNGLTYLDFVWNIPTGATPDLVNTNQSFLPNVLMNQANESGNTLQAIDNQRFKNKFRGPDFVAYPNPVVDMLQINFPETTSEAHVEVYNIFGKLIDYRVIDAGTGKTMIDFSNQMPGQYLVYIHFDSERVLKIVMKQ